MVPPPRITVVSVIHGPFPAAAALNHKIDPVHPILRATIDITWDDPEPAAAIGRLERTLRPLSPTFERHECRGPRAYHVFLGDGAGPGPAPAGPDGGFDGRLALAHVIEHVVIDFLFAAGGQDRCSGVTGARRDNVDRYDLLIECDDDRLGRLCLGLAVAVVTSAFHGQPLGAADRDPIAVARLARARPGRPLTPPEVERALAWDEGRVRRALAVLRRLGYLREEIYAMNLSGIPEYRAAAR
jgi:hypothetical protein